MLNFFRSLAILTLSFSLQQLYGDTSSNTLYDGSLSTSNGNSVTANGNWKSGGGSFLIDWSVTQMNDKTYNYTYSITNKDGGRLSSNLSYVLLQIGSTVTSQNLNTLITNIQGGSITSGPSTFTTANNSRLPGNIYAIMIDTTSNTLPVFSFTSSLAPIWGNFFAQGTSSTTYAYNAAFNSGNNAMMIAIPGGGANITAPEPSTYLILGGLLFFLGFKSRKRRLTVK